MVMFEFWPVSAPGCYSLFSWLQLQLAEMLYFDLRNENMLPIYIILNKLEMAALTAPSSVCGSNGMSVEIGNVTS